jgi:hypothetical protein
LDYIILKIIDLDHGKMWIKSLPEAYRIFLSTIPEKTM